MAYSDPPADGLAGDGLTADGLAGDGLAGDGLAGGGLAGGGLAAGGLTGGALDLDLTTGRTARTRHQRRAEPGGRRRARSNSARPDGERPDSGRSDGERPDSGRSGGGRAGRNLPAAITVGVLLGAAVLASLFLWRPAFLIVVALAACVGVTEMVGAIRKEAPRVPLVPLLAGTVVIVVLAWTGGVETAVLGLALTVLAALVWRLADGPAGYHRDLAATAFIAIYVPFLASFAVMLAKPDDGDLRVVATLAAVVLSDTGGYVAGVLFGKHPMAPRISPKKSWEGLAGSLLATAIGSALLLDLLLHQPWWQGALFGLAICVASVIGDLAESLIKRDLGIKDMSALLPGHGGLMDRLDSILFAAPTSFVLLSVLVS